MPPDPLRRTYTRMDDRQLVEVATYRLQDLTPEAVTALRSELELRGLHEVLGPALVAQAPSTPEERDRFMHRFRELPCPECGATGRLLNAARVMSVTSYLIATVCDDQVVVGCPDCIVQAAARAEGQPRCHCAALGQRGRMSAPPGEISFA